MAIPPMLTQPLIENVFEHARLESEKSPRIVVSYKKLNDELEVTIEDNGVGFDVANLNEKLERHQPIAIEIIKERLDLLRKMHKGGRSEMEITNLASEGLKGTRVRFWLPLISNT